MNLAGNIDRMRVRIVRKLADRMDGIDLSHCRVGDLVDLAERQARIMIAEQWAVFARRAGDMVVSPASGETLASAFASDGRRLLGDRRRSSRLDDLYQRLRDKREEIDQERRQVRRRSTDTRAASDKERAVASACVGPQAADV